MPPAGDMKAGPHFVSRLMPSAAVQSVMDTSLFWQRKISGSMRVDYPSAFWNCNRDKSLEKMDRYMRTRSPRGGGLGRLRLGQLAPIGRRGSRFKGKVAVRIELMPEQVRGYSLSHSEKAHGLVFAFQLVLAKIIEADVRVGKSAYPPWDAASVWLSRFMTLSMRKTVFTVSPMMVASRWATSPMFPAGDYSMMERNRDFKGPFLRHQSSGVRRPSSRASRHCPERHAIRGHPGSRASSKPGRRRR